MAQPEIITREEAKARGLKRYFTGKPCKRGHVAKRNVSNSTCSACDSAKSKEWSKANPNYLQNRRAQLSADPFSPKNSMSIARHMLRKTQGRAKERGMKFFLTLQDIFPLPTRCPILDCELVYLVSRDDQHRLLPHSASLDRIDNDKGYTPGNVQIVSWRANHIKSDATVEELEAVLKHMKETEV